MEIWWNWTELEFLGPIHVSTSCRYLSHFGCSTACSVPTETHSELKKTRNSGPDKKSQKTCLKQPPRKVARCLFVVRAHTPFAKHRRCLAFWDKETKTGFAFQREMQPVIPHDFYVFSALPLECSALVPPPHKQAQMTSCSWALKQKIDSLQKSTNLDQEIFWARPLWCQSSESAVLAQFVNCLAAPETGDVLKHDLYAKGRRQIPFQPEWPLTWQHRGSVSSNRKMSGMTELRERVLETQLLASCFRCLTGQKVALVGSGPQWRIQYFGGVLTPGGLNPKCAQNGGFSFNLPENCMILNKFLGARGPGPKGPPDPLVGLQLAKKLRKKCLTTC